MFWTIIISLFLAAGVALAIRSIVRGRKSGADCSSCSACNSCASSGANPSGKPLESEAAKASKG